jgi:putative ABC transport system ATP-binding protein
MAQRKKVPLISIQYVSKSYDDNPLAFDHLVLKNVNLEIHDGEFVIIYGPSGSGKSSLLNLIAGLENPTAGRVMLRRRDLSHFDHKELARYHRLKMGMVFQSFNLIKSLNVWENVALPQTANGASYTLRKRKALRLLKLLGLSEYPDRHANELSGGEQQRVAIARSLINKPFFLLVDEPTGNLDSKSAAEVMKIFDDLNKHGKHTIIMVTHNPEQLQFASRVVHVQDGTIVRDEYRNEADREKYAAITIPLALPKEHLDELATFKTDLDEHGQPTDQSEPRIPVKGPGKAPDRSALVTEAVAPVGDGAQAATAPVASVPVAPQPILVTPPPVSKPISTSIQYMSHAAPAQPSVPPVTPTSTTSISPPLSPPQAPPVPTPAVNTQPSPSQPVEPPQSTNATTPNVPREDK